MTLKQIIMSQTLRGKEPRFAWIQWRQCDGQPRSREKQRSRPIRLSWWRDGKVVRIPAAALRAGED